jgi:hypothetical protein
LFPGLQAKIFLSLLWSRARISQFLPLLSANLVMVSKCPPRLLMLTLNPYCEMLRRWKLTPLWCLEEEPLEDNQDQIRPVWWSSCDCILVAIGRQSPEKLYIYTHMLPDSRHVMPWISSGLRQQEGHHHHINHSNLDLQNCDPT